jgi:hypothetical protein
MKTKIREIIFNDDKIIYDIKKEDIFQDASEGKLKFLYSHCRYLERRTVHNVVTYIFENSLSHKEIEECLENY